MRSAVSLEYYQIIERLLMAKPINFVRGFYF